MMSDRMTIQTPASRFNLALAALLLALGMSAFAAPAMANDATVSGTVNLDPAMAAKVTPSSVMFIFAKAEGGMPMPVAALRQPTDRFPLTFTLDKSMAMMPTYSLAQVTEVTVTARISARGDAIAHSGDLQGSVGPVKVGAKGLEITIDTVLP